MARSWRLCSWHASHEPCVDQPILRRNIMLTLRIVAAMSLCLSALALGGCQTTTSGGAVGARAQATDAGFLAGTRPDGGAELQQAESRCRGQGHAQYGSARWSSGFAQWPPASNRRPGYSAADAPGWKWEVNVITSNELNAYCMPGGKIMFYSGLIRQLNLSDDEIAVVMGHEISHALREHSREQVSQAIAAQTAIGVGAALLGLGQGSADVAGIAYQALIATRFSRTDENEADRIGLELTARAGYDPRAGVSLWQKMIKANSGGRPPEFLQQPPDGFEPGAADRGAAADGHAVLHGRAPRRLSPDEGAALTPESGLPKKKFPRYARHRTESRACGRHNRRSARSFPVQSSLSRDSRPWREPKMNTQAHTNPCTCGCWWAVLPGYWSAALQLPPWRSRRAARTRRRPLRSRLKQSRNSLLRHARPAPTGARNAA